MPTDSEAIDRLSSLSERLPVSLAAFSECLARERERAVGGEFYLTGAQREQVDGILAALALGREGEGIPSQVPASEYSASLAERVRVLRERKKSIEAELVQATDELVKEVGLGVTVAAATFKVRIAEPRLVVKIKDPKLVPAAFLSLQPDRKAILEHVRARAEVPPGADISETRPTVYFSSPK